MTRVPLESALLLAAAVAAAVWPAVCSLRMETQYILRVTYRAIRTYYKYYVYVLVPGRAAVGVHYQGMNKRL